MSTPAEHLLQHARASEAYLREEDVRRAATHRQLAIVRTLADELERCVACGGASEMLREQLTQELTRLGCRTLETAATMTDADGDDASGVHRVAARAWA